MDSAKTKYSGKPVIGIVGGVGAGKSTVAAQFASLGCAVIDADAIGHDLLAQPDVQRELVALWGPGVIASDGSVDRAAVAKLAFASPESVAALNAIMHWRIRRRIEEGIAAGNADANVRAIVLDAAIMIEAGWDDLCTHLVFVSAGEAERQRRVADGRGWDRLAWQSREKSQFSLDTKRKRCYFSIDNDASIFCLSEQVREILTKVIHENDLR
ncbi:MAG: dephospho-CoA kinase [Planctomycetaceae bacterium]|nr:MAG: dephospho-CoA kinase [Planctomycetaceae bacterium]